MSRSRSNWIAKLITLFSFGLLLNIFVGISSADIEIPDIEEGDSIWATIDVDSPGLVSVTAWTNGGNNDNIELHLFNQSDIVANAYGSYDQVSIDDFSLSSGRYTINAYLTDARGGGTRTISITSNRQLSLLPKNKKSNFDVAEGKANYFYLNVDGKGLIFLNAWTNGSKNDNIELHLYNQTDLVDSAYGSYDQVSISYFAPSVGMYTVKAYLTDAHGGGTRTVSVTSNYPVSDTISSVKYDIVKTINTSKTSPLINIEDIQLIDAATGSYYVSGTVSDTDGIKFIKINDEFVAVSDQFGVLVTNNFYGDVIDIEVGDTIGDITQQEIQIIQVEKTPWYKYILDNLILPIIVILVSTGIIALIKIKKIKNKTN